MGDTIEYCLHNVDETIRERLGTAETDAEVVEQRCLQRCGTCYSEDFLVIDGSLTTAGSHAALMTDYGIMAQEDR